MIKIDVEGMELAALRTAEHAGARSFALPGDLR